MLNRHERQMEQLADEMRQLFEAGAHIERLQLQLDADHRLLVDALRAFEWLAATAEEYYMVSGFVPGLGYRRQEFDDATHGLRKALKNADTVLADPRMVKVLAEVKDGA